MALNDALAVLKQHGITVEEGQGAVEVPGAIDFHFYNLPAGKSIDTIEIFATQKEGEKEMSIRRMKLYPFHHFKPHELSGEKRLYFESLSLDEIISFQDSGVEPDGGNPLPIP